MTENYYHIKFPGIDITLKNAWMRTENIEGDDYELEVFDFYLENIDRLSFNTGTVFKVVNEFYKIDYLCEVIKNYDNSLLLRILEL